MQEISESDEDKKTLVSTNGDKESSEIDLLEKSPLDEKKQENDSIKKRCRLWTYTTGRH